MRESLYAYGQIEFHENRELVTMELDAYKRFLAGAQHLEQESAGIGQLQKQLEDLSKNKGWFQSMKDAAAFGQKVKEEYDRLLCDQSKSQEKDLNNAIAAIDEKLRKATAADRAPLTAEKAKLEAGLKEVQTRKQSLDKCK